MTSPFNTGTGDGKVMPIDTPLTMSSREIAELTGKHHRNVLRDIRAYVGAILKMERGLDVKSLDWNGSEGVALFEHTPIGGVTLVLEENEQNGERYPIYCLDKKATLTVVSGYNVLLRAKIIDRWLDLEAAIGSSHPTIELIELADQARVANEGTRDLIIHEGGNTRGAIIKTIREIAGNPIAALKQYLDDRFVALHKRDTHFHHALAAFGQHQAEVVAMAKRSMEPDAFVARDWVAVNGVYALAGIHGPIPRQKSLSARVTTSLVAFCIETNRQMDMRGINFTGKVHLYRATAVRAWLKDRGARQIAEHIAKHSAQTVIQFPCSTKGEA